MSGEPSRADVSTQGARMNANVSSAEEAFATTRGTAVGATALMLLLHGLCYMAISVPSVIAPVAARSFGVDASRVGVLVASTYVFIIVAGLACGVYTARHGVMRICQLSAVLSAAGLLLAAGIGWAVAGFSVPDGGAAAAMSLLLFASIGCIGLGMGLVNPLSSQVLFASTPPQYRTLAFSIKQMGSPIGTAAAGLVLPVLLLHLSWPWALAVAALPAALFALLAPGMPRYMCRYDQAAANMRSRLGWNTFTEPVRLMLRSRALREWGVVSTLLAMNQVSVAAILVTFLSLKIGLPLVTAGSLFALTQLTGLLGRALFGYSAGRWISPRRQVALLGVGAAASAFALAAAGPEWPFAALVAICAVFGATSLAWNGISLSEVARLAGPGQVGMVTGGAQTFMSAGAILGPVLFSALVAVTGQYALGFIATALPVLGVSLRMLGTREP